MLILIVPMPAAWRVAISKPLQSVTAEISSWLLGMLGVATQTRGSVIVINEQPVAVAEACNGMRMVFPLLLISYGFAFGLPLRAGVRALIVLLSPLVALGLQRTAGAAVDLAAGPGHVRAKLGRAAARAERLGDGAAGIPDPAGAHPRCCVG